MTVAYIAPFSEDVGRAAAAFACEHWSLKSHPDEFAAAVTDFYKGAQWALEWAQQRYAGERDRYEARIRELEAMVK